MALSAFWPKICGEKAAESEGGKLPIRYDTMAMAMAMC